ncbi:MAG: hypothetical protein LBF27_13410 [Sphingobacterium sp.]|jgi:DNA polymerase-4|nr:hypothetical protein [Sphingobacterium sp.]
MERSIVHCDFDTHFVSVELLQNSKLIEVPALIGGGCDPGIVAFYSYEMHQFGVHSAMLMRLATGLP